MDFRSDPNPMFPDHPDKNAQLCLQCGIAIHPNMIGVLVCGNCMFLTERKHRSQLKLKAPKYGNKSNQPRHYDDALRW